MPSTAPPATEHSPTLADFYATNRGGGLFTELISQRIGSVIALVCARTGIRPTVLSLGNLLIGLGVALVLVLRADAVSPALGVIALLGWQLAYAMDCADGQLARVTGQGSPAGARIDILCDVAVQIALIVALVAVAAAPVWLAALFAGCWMVNLVTSVLASNDGQAGSMVTSRSLPVRLIKLVRDYGAVILLAGLVLTFAPSWTIWFIVAFTVVNGAFLLASIAFTARAALRS